MSAMAERMSYDESWAEALYLAQCSNTLDHRLANMSRAEAARLMGGRWGSVSAAEEPFRCEHHESGTRRRRIKSGALVVHDQCVTCGASTRVHKNRNHDLRLLAEWDYDLATTWANARMLATSAAILAQATLALDQRSEWFSAHSAYLRSEAWQRLRALVIQRDQGRCQGCWTAGARHVHHLTYQRWRRELLLDLVLLCEACHERIHEGDKGHEDDTTSRGAAGARQQIQATQRGRKDGHADDGGIDGAVMQTAPGVQAHRVRGVWTAFVNRAH